MCAHIGLRQKFPHNLFMPLSPRLPSNIPGLQTMSHVPHLLAPYIALPSERSLVLLTSVLGASTNWLVLRFIQNILVPNFGSVDNTNDEDDGGNKTENKSNVKVLFVSFMRDLAFWKDGARKLVRDLMVLSM